MVKAKWKMRRVTVQDWDDKMNWEVDSKDRIKHNISDFVPWLHVK